MIRVCHILKITGVAGSENHLLSLASGLDRRRYRFTFCLLTGREPDLTDYIAALEAVGVEVARLPIRADLDPPLLWRLARFLRTAKPDIVHTHLIHGDLYGTLAARLAGVPAVVSTKHNDNAFRRRGFYAWLDRALARQQDRIITISHHLKRFCVEVERLPAEKITPIHYGLDADAFLRVQSGEDVRHEFGIPSGAPLIGVVGRLIEQKGHRYLLAALAHVVEALPAAHLLIAGDGALRPALEQQVADLALAKRVTFTGWRRDVTRIMAAIDVLVMPSLWEGFGLVLLEAMAASRPVVASQVSAIPEIVAHGETGLLVPPKDAAALARALLTLLREPSRAQAMGRRGRQRLAQQFTVGRMVEQTQAVYESLLN
ncbi:MAG: glycosyltransferase family 4 protein [Chloroflexota bacterium]